MNNNLRLPLFLAALTLLCAAPRAADAEVTPDMRRRLNKVNSISQKGARKVPSNYRSGYEKNAKKLKEAEKLYKEARALMGPELKAITSYASVYTRFKKLEDGVIYGRMQLAALKAYEQIMQAHNGGKIVDDKLLDALAAAARKFADKANNDHQRAAKWWVEQADKARTRNAKLAKEGAAKAAKALAKGQIQAASDAMDKLTFALDDMKYLAVQNQGPIPQNMLDTFAAGVAEVEKKYQPKAGLFYRDARWDYDIYNAWWQGASAPAAVANVMQGELITKGTSKGKKLKYTVKTKADWCYAEVRRWQRRSGSEKMDLDWKAGKHYSHMQEFSIWSGRNVWGGLSGICTTKAVQVKRQGKLTFAGSRNALDYVVVGWPKDKFPMQVASRMTVIKSDPCDPEGWFQSFTRPIPGALAFLGQEPVLWKERDDPWTSILSASNGERRDKLTKLSSKAPAARGFGRSTWSFRCYSLEGSNDPVAIKYGKCVRAVNKKYAPKIGSASKALDRAKTPGQYRAASKKLDRAKAARGKEMTRKCDPVAGKIRKRMDKAFARIADWHADNTFVSRLDVMQFIRDQAEGESRPTLTGEPWDRREYEKWWDRRRKHQKSQGRKLIK